MGAILHALDAHGVADRTLVIFLSDNGPFLSYGSHAGSAGPFREGKLTSFEGGMRVPCIARWPGHVPAGRRVDAIVSAMDLCAIFERLPRRRHRGQRDADQRRLQRLPTGR